MKIYFEDSIRNFHFWSGAVDTANALTDKELDRVETELEAIYPEGMSDTQLNDLFWCESDFIATLLGYDDWETFENKNNKVELKYSVDDRVNYDGEQARIIEVDENYTYRIQIIDAPSIIHRVSEEELED